MKYVIEFILIVVLVVVSICAAAATDPEPRRSDEWGDGPMGDSPMPSEESWRWDEPAP